MNIKSLTKIAFWTVVAIMAILIIINVAFRSFHYADGDIKSLFDSSNANYNVQYIDAESASIRCVVEDRESTDSVLLVFIHGAPGSFDAFKSYMQDSEITEHCRVVAYDRPGYGNSSSDAMTSIMGQSSILQLIIENYKEKHVGIVSHSYGGAIGGYLSVIQSDLIDTHIMISPLIDPDSEPIFWFSYFGKWKFTSMLLPNEFGVAGLEKFSHSAELMKISSSWDSIKTRTIHFHGLKDGLAPPHPNINFAKENIPQKALSQIIDPESGHLVIWTEYDKVKKIILDYLPSSH